MNVGNTPPFTAREAHRLTDEVVRERGGGRRDGAVLAPTAEPPLEGGGQGGEGHEHGIPQQVARGDGDDEGRPGGAVQRVGQDGGALRPQRVQREAGYCCWVELVGG